MKVTKIGHCCLLIETRGKRLLTDPGRFSAGQNVLTGIDVILVTHEHTDHFHLDSVREILRNNRGAEIVANSAVGKLLDAEKVPHRILEKHDSAIVSGIAVEAYDGKHEEIYENFGQVRNTGYFIDGTLFYPGDSFHEPERPVPLLALPVAGPWCKMGDAIRYALRVNPRKAFPVHDAVVAPDAVDIFHRTPAKILAELGIDFVSLRAGESLEF